MSAGGSTSSGGTANAGGASAAGGSVSSGGSTSTGGSGNCTDTPPPNGDTCENAVDFGWCGQDWLNGACAQSCGTCEGGGTGGSSGAGGSSSSGGTSNGSGGTFGGGGGQPPRIDGGTPAWASRYWDCCKPACGWQGNVQSGGPMKSCSRENQPLGGNDDRNACESGGSAYMCWSGVPWAVSDTLAYGFAAASGDNYRCGACYQLQFTGSGHHGNNAGAQALNGKTMIIQVINNGGVASDQFDILIPGGGVGDFDACTSQWGVSDLGARYGGFMGGCNGDAGCVRNKCNEVFADKPDLMRGCDWFLDWYEAADNPNLVYAPIDCPAALTQASGLQDPR